MIYKRISFFFSAAAIRRGIRMDGRLCVDVPNRIARNFHSGRTPSSWIWFLLPLSHTKRCGFVSSWRIAGFCWVAPRGGRPPWCAFLSSSRGSARRGPVYAAGNGKLFVYGSRLSSSELLFLERSVGMHADAGQDEPSGMGMGAVVWFRGCNRNPNDVLLRRLPATPRPEYHRRMYSSFL